MKQKLKYSEFQEIKTVARHFVFFLPLNYGKGQLVILVGSVETFSSNSEQIAHVKKPVAESILVRASNQKYTNDEVAELM